MFHLLNSQRLGPLSKSRHHFCEHSAWQQSVVAPILIGKDDATPDWHESSSPARAARLQWPTDGRIKRVAMFDQITNLFSTDLGIDLGTANTLVYARNCGIVLREPSVVAVESRSGRVIAAGNDAKQMMGRTPGGITVIRPMRDGVIGDFKMAEAMLRHFIAKVQGSRRFMRLRIVVAVPSGITEVERRAVIESAKNAGARDVVLIEEPMAAAIGAGLPVEDAAASMIVDIGGGTTEVALISLSGIVLGRSVRVAGDKLDEAVRQYVKRAYNLMIGERTAEDIKMKIGSVEPLQEELSLLIRGRDLAGGMPKEVVITSAEIRRVLLGPMAIISDAVRYTLESCPPELSGDLLHRGMVLAGGGALIRGIDRLLSTVTGLPVRVAEDPLSTIAEGTGRALGEMNVIRRTPDMGAHAAPYYYPQYASVAA